MTSNKKIERVMTFDGILMPKDKVRHIQGEYYIPNKSCFKVGNRWYRINSGMIELDHTTKEYALKSTLLEGVVDYSNGSIVLGFYSSKLPREAQINIFTKEGQRYFALNESILSDNFVEDLSTGFFYEKGNKSIDYSGFNYKRRSGYAGVLNNGNPEPNYYFWDDCPFRNQLTEYYNNLEIPISNDVQKISRLIKGITFGIEFECNNGTIPLRHLFNCGTVVVRDGSVKGYEYTTIPMSGAKGLQTIINFCAYLQKYCTFDQYCSLHIHFGNLRDDKLYLLATYMAAYKLQQEIFDLVPYYKRDPVTIIKTEKNYCKPLPSLNIVNDKLISSKSGKEFSDTVEMHYQQLFKFLSGGVEADRVYNRTTHVHPQGDEKWKQLSRYHYFNIMPMIFGKHKTMESRIHHMTFSPDKIINWLLFNVAFLKFCDSNTKEILKSNVGITVENVLKGYLDDFMYEGKRTSSFRTNIVSTLIKYFDQRKQQFSNEMMNHQYISEKELFEDNACYEYSVINSLDTFYKGVIPNDKKNNERNKTYVKPITGRIVNKDSGGYYKPKPTLIEADNTDFYFEEEEGKLLENDLYKKVVEPNVVKMEDSTSKDLKKDIAHTYVETTKVDYMEYLDRLYPSGTATSKEVLETLKEQRKTLANKITKSIKTSPKRNIATRVKGFLDDAE